MKRFETIISVTKDEMNGYLNHCRLGTWKRMEWKPTEPAEYLLTSHVEPVLLVGLRLTWWQTLKALFSRRDRQLLHPVKFH